MKTTTIRRLLILCSIGFAAVGADGAVLSGPVSNPANGSTYYLLASSTWTSAESEAVTLGGHLATINDQAENDWVFSNFAAFGGTPRILWIGLQEVGSVGQFEWANGELATFTNWASGEPNNGLVEPYVSLWDATHPEPYRAPGTWNDFGDISSFEGITLHGVVEITPVPEPSMYALIGGSVLVLLALRRSATRRAA